MPMYNIMLHPSRYDLDIFKTIPKSSGVTNIELGLENPTDVHLLSPLLSGELRQSAFVPRQEPTDVT